MKKFKVVLEKIERVTKRAEFVIEANDAEELELCLEGMTYEDIEEDLLDHKLNWKLYDKDLKDTSQEISEVVDE